MAEEIERIFVIPLKKPGFKSSVAAPTAIKRVKKYLIRHMKVEEDKIWIDDSLNNALWARGKYKIPGKIRIKAVKFDDGVVEAYLPELEFKKSRRELIKEEREKKAPILRKEEVEETGEDEEDIEVAPTADGEVKIKKKKAKKDKKDTKDESKEEKTAKAPKKTEEKEDAKEKKKPTKKSEKKTEKKTTKTKTAKKSTKSKSSSKKSTAKKTDSKKKSSAKKSEKKK